MSNSKGYKKLIRLTGLVGLDLALQTQCEVGGSGLKQVVHGAVS